MYLRFSQQKGHILVLQVILLGIFAVASASAGDLTLQPLEPAEGFAEINLGMVQLTTRFDYIIHKIDPDEIRNILESFENNTALFQNSTYEGLIKAELEAINNILHTLLPKRTKRGLIDGIGTGLKMLFGTMDTNDRQFIEQHLELIETNGHEMIDRINRQVHINEYFNNSLRAMKQVIESDREKLKAVIGEIQGLDTEILKEEVAVRQLLKLQVLHQKVIQIQQNVIAARLGFINPGILSKEEIDRLDIRFEKLEGIKMGVATYQNRLLIFVVKVPSESAETDRKLIIPIPNKEKMQVNCEPEIVIQYDNTTWTYEIGKASFELKPSKHCVALGKCDLVKFRDEKLYEFDENIIIMVNANQSLFSSTCDHRVSNLENHWFIAFHNCSITIGARTMKSMTIAYKQRFVETQHQFVVRTTQKLSFDDLTLQQQETTKEIQELKFHKAIAGGVGGGVTILGALAIVTLLWKVKKLKLRPRLNNEGSKNSVADEIIAKYASAPNLV